ncbi:MAG: AAA family ATPase [Planctomycetes bacterium]|nr:AAA family ATPase [Planctomycetota bacterium]
MSNLHAGISEVAIRNFRGIEDLTLKFEQPSGYPTQVGVIAGPNGSGKTSVLEACLAAGAHRDLVKGQLGKSAVRFGQADYQIDITIRVQSETYEARATAQSHGRSVIPFAYFSSWRAPQLVGSLGITAGKRGRRPKLNEQNRLWNIKQFLINARAHEFFPKTTQPVKSRFESVAHDLNHVWNLFFPGQSFVVEPVDERPDEGFDVFLLDRGARLPIDALSSGQLEIFMFAGGLAIEEFQQGIILIDEPELHLDPQWHRTFLKALAYLKPECQIIVGTHSPEVFDSVMSFERHFLVPAEDRRANAWLSGFGKGA